MSTSGAGPVTSAAPSSHDKTAPSLRWHQRILGFCLVIFALELGLFLIVFPWRKSWDLSWVPAHSQSFATVWMSRYFRGALSGLGLLNVYIAFAELSRQLRSLFRL